MDLSLIKLCRGSGRPLGEGAWGGFNNITLAPYCADHSGGTTKFLKLASRHRPERVRNRPEHKMRQDRISHDRVRIHELAEAIQSEVGR